MTTQERNTVILARVSSKAQEDEGYSLDSQLKLLESYCENKELFVIKVFRIAETASKEQSRRVFHELLAYIKKEKVFHLAVEKTDRLTRNLKDAVAIDDWLQGNPSRMLHAVKENLVVHKEARSDVKFMWNIHLAVAKKYTDNLREEAMKGWAEKLAQGWMPAPPPPGYMTVLENGKRIHVLNPQTAPIIKQAFLKYLEAGGTIKTTTEFLYNSGVLSRKGRPLANSAVHKNIQNPFYIGLIHFNGRVYEGSQVPLLDKKTFDAVQAKISGKSPARRRVHNVPLKGLVMCAYCKHAISWQVQRGHYYGTCQRTLSECRERKYVRQDFVEDIIIQQLDKLISPSKEVIDWLVDELTDSKEVIQTENSMQEVSLRQRARKLKNMDEMLYEDKLSGEISRDKYMQKHQSFVDEIKAIEEKLTNIDTDFAVSVDNRITILQLTQRASEEYQVGDNEKRQDIIGKLIESIEVDKNCVIIRLSELVAMIAHSSLRTRELMKKI